MRLRAMALAVGTLAQLYFSGKPPANGQGQQDWPAYGGGAERIRYSPLKQINAASVRLIRGYETGGKGRRDEPSGGIYVAFVLP